MTNRPQHEQVFEKKVRRVEKALAALGKTRGEFQRVIVNKTGERLFGKVAEAIAKLNTPAQEDLFSLDGLVEEDVERLEKENAGLIRKRFLSAEDGPALAAGSPEEEL